MRIVRRGAGKHRELRSKDEAETYASSAVLSPALGSEDFFVRHEHLAPGRRASLPHRHEKTDELVIVIAGALTAECGAETRELRAGDVLNFPKGSAALHGLRNEGGEPAEYYVVSRNLLMNDVIYGKNSAT